MSAIEQKEKQQFAEIDALIKEGIQYKDIAKRLGISVRTLSRRLSKMRSVGFELPEQSGQSRPLPYFSRWDIPKQERERLDDLSFRDESEDDLPIEELIESRKQRFDRVETRQRKRQIRKVKVNIPGPIGIVHFGDPHVDDDGCNWPKLLKAVETVSKTPGMFAGNIGDTTNNWVGRLQKLWAHQSTTLDEAVRLAHWLFHSMPWLYSVLGNHDKWNNGAQLLRYLTHGSSIAVFAQSVARIELSFPKGDPIRIVARHDFKGSSIWNRAHGPMRESKMNPWADIYISGHRHCWVSHHEEGTDGKPRWSILVRGFKWFDEYAEEHGFYEHELGETCTTIIDPEARSPTERVKLIWDVEEAAETLNWMRQRAGASNARIANPLT